MGPIENGLNAFIQTINDPQPNYTVFERSLIHSVSVSVAAWKQHYSPITWTMGAVVETPNRASFRYSVTGAEIQSSKVASWTGSGVAVVNSGKIFAYQLQEDHWGRVTNLGQLAQAGWENISGHWTGSLDSIGVTIDLQEIPGGGVNGTLWVLNNNMPVAVPVNGNNNAPNVILSGNTPNGPINFNGTWDGNNCIHGFLNGGGLMGNTVTMTRA